MLKTLTLSTFRNYEKQSFCFTDGINGVFGDNGSGKTTILEAISFLSTGRSFRTQSVEEVIMQGTEGFGLDATLYSGTKLRVARHENEKRVIINGTKHSMFSRVIGSLPTVIFTPKDIALISGSPLDRRRFLDILLTQKTPLYLHFLTRYARTLKQRNALLKSKKTDGLDAFNQSLAAYGTKLIAYRKEAFALLSEYIKDTGRHLSPDHAEIGITYTPSIHETSESAYLMQIERSQKRDTLYQTTHLGPHRDDFYLSYNGYKAKQYASEGQKRSALAALKCAEYDLLADESDIPPLFCIDDYSVHLDTNRIAHLLSKIQTLPQVLITAPDAPSFHLSNTIELDSLLKIS